MGSRALLIPLLRFPWHTQIVHQRQVSLVQVPGEHMLDIRVYRETIPLRHPLTEA